MMTLQPLSNAAHKHDVMLSLETDLSASEVDAVTDEFGISVTLDTGNLLRLGYSLDEHLDAYCGKVDNVHVKDCIRGGTSVPLGSGGLDKGLLRHVIKRTGASRVTFQTSRERHIKYTDLQLFEQNKRWVEEACDL